MDPAATPPHTVPETAQSETADGVIDHDQMKEHLLRGQAAPLSRMIPEFVRYDERWWIADHGGWLVVDDDRLIAKLDNHRTWASGNLYRSHPGNTQ